jgi:hypothetical protein
MNINPSLEIRKRSPSVQLNFRLSLDDLWALGDCNQGSCPFGVRLAFNRSAEPEKDFVLTNLVQAEAVLPGLSTAAAALPFHTAGQSPSSFADALQTADTVASATPRLDVAAVAARGKSAEKRTTDNPKTTAPVQAMQAIVPAIIPDIKFTSTVTTFAVSPPLPDLAGSLATARSILPQGESARPGAGVGSVATVNLGRENISIGPATEIQQQASTQNSVAVSEFASSALLPAGKQMQTSDLASPANSAATSVKQVNPLPVAQTGMPIPPPNTSDAGQRPPAPDMQSVSSQASAKTLTSTLAVADEPAETPLPAPVELAPRENGAPLNATDPTRDTGNAAGEVIQAPVDTKPQTVDGDLRALALTLLPTGAPLAAMDPASKATRTIPGIDQSFLGSEPPVSNSSGRKTPAAPVSSSSISSTAYSPEIPNSGSLLPMLGMKATETISPAEKEIPPARVPSDQEHTTLKATDASSIPADANTQTITPSAPSAASAGPVAGAPPSSPTAIANVLLQVSPTAIQDSGSRNASPPAATEPQPAAASSATPLPAVGAVETARLVAGVAQSEMHMGIQTQAFGNIEVHTVVRDSQVGLTVGSERGDLRTLLAPEVSGLQTTFRQQDLRFDNIRFLDTNSGTTAGFSGGGDSQPRSSSQQHSFPAEVFSIHSPPEDSAEPDISSGLRMMLNVHA